MKTVCFTGRRPQKLPWGFDESDSRCTELKNKLKDKIKTAIDAGATHFISGMALGVDMWAAEIVIEFKKEGYPITLEAAIPFRKQADSWKYDHRERHARIVKNCDKVTVVSEYYTSYCMMNRNRYMVESSDLVIAVLDDFTGGSGKTALYARSKNIPVWVMEV